MKRIAWTFVVIATLVLAVWLLLTSRLAAQPPQPARAQATPQDVPDTPAPPPAPIQPIPYSHKTHLALGIRVPYMPHESGAARTDDLSCSGYLHAVSCDDRHG